LTKISRNRCETTQIRLHIPQAAKRWTNPSPTAEIVKVCDRICHNTVVGAIELAELGDGIVPTPRITLKLGRIPYDPLNLGRQPRMFAMA
jgi:hypothetical protein